MFGDAIVDNEKIAVNDAFKPEEFTYMCKLPSGADFYVNSLAAECDLLVTEGFIEPHFFAGFSGGRKSILPGICNEVTVNENHSYRAISNQNAQAGVLQLVRNKGELVSEEYVPEGISIRAYVPMEVYGKLISLCVNFYNPFLWLWF